MHDLDSRKLGLASGILWGAACLLMGLTATYLSGYGSEFVNLLGPLYFGYYEATLTGSIIGGLIGFVDGMIGGALLAWLYNRV